MDEAERTIDSLEKESETLYKENYELKQQIKANQQKLKDAKNLWMRTQAEHEHLVAQMKKIDAVVGK